MIQLTPTLYEVEVPIDAKNVTIVTLSKTRKALSYTVDEYGGYSTAFKDILNHDFKVLGEVTKDEINLSTENLVDWSDFEIEGYGGVFHPITKSWDYIEKSFSLRSSDESFRSLLQSKGIDLNKENVKRIILEKL